MMTISPDPTGVPPIRMSMFSPAERVIRMTLPLSSPRISRTVMFFRASSAFAFIGMSARCAISSKTVIERDRFDLLLQSDGFLAHLIDRGNNTGIGLVTALKNDEVGEFASDIGCGSLNRSSEDRAAAPRARQPDGGQRSTGARFEGVVADSEQRLGIADGSHGQLSRHDLCAIGVLRQDRAAIGQAHAHEVGRGRAVLCQGRCSGLSSELTDSRGLAVVK